MTTAIATTVAALCVFVSGANASTLFAGNQTPGGISALKLDAAGQPSPVAGSPFVTSQEPRALIGTPDGTRLFAGHRTISTISRQSAAIDGTLATLGPDVPFAPTAPQYAAVSPDGRFLYYSSASFDAGLQYFAIGSDGSLSPAGTAPVLSNGGSAAITPDGRFLYVCSSTKGIHAFSLDTAGTPTALPGFPSLSIACTGSAITPDGRFLLTSESGSGLRVYAIGSAGGLTQVGDAIMAGANPNHIAVSPDGKSVYVLNIGGAAASGSITQFALSSAGAISTVGVDVIVTVPSVFASGIAVSPDGRFVVAASNTVTSNLHVFATNAGGQLTAVAGSPFYSGASMAGGSPINEVAFRTNQGPSVAGLTVGGKNRSRTFAAAGATDSDGAVSSYVWDFGDGSSATTSTPNAKHTYSKSGNYSASVRVVDDENCSATDIYDGRKFLCNASGSASASQTADALPPSFSKLKFTKKSVPVGGKVKLKYKLSQAATVKVTFQTRKGKKYKNRGSLTFKSKAGSRSRNLTLKIKKRKLPTGSYRVLIEGTDAANNTSSAKRLKLKVR